MVDYDNELEKEGRPPREVVIEDLRHRRDASDEPEEEEIAEEPEPAPAAPVILEVPQAAAEQPLGQTVAAAGDSAGTPPADLADAFTEEYEGDPMAPGEMDQIRALFTGGLPNYLRGQLGLLLNFALLGMGRAADPSTGLVSRNLPHAKLAIDILEFIIGRIEPELAVEEKAQMHALVSDLKYAFMQAASEGVPVPPTQAES